MTDDLGRERERYKVPYGSKASSSDGDKVDGGQTIAGIRIRIQYRWCTARFSDIVDGSTATVKVGGAYLVQLLEIPATRDRSSNAKDLRLH